MENPARPFASPKPLHIAMVTETYPPEINGVALTIGRFVDSLRSRDYHVEVVRPRQKQEQSTASPSSFEVLSSGIPIPGYPDLRMGLPLGKLLRKRWSERRPDVVHIATEGPLGWSALAVARALKIPTVAGFHTNFHRYSGHYGIGWLQPMIQAYLRHFHNRACLNLVPTRLLQKELLADNFASIEVLGRGVDTALFSPERRSQQLRQKWGLADDDLAVIHVSRIAPEKNLKLLELAFAAIKKAQPNARLIMVGSGPAESSLRARHPDYIFCGMRTGEDLAAHYASADVFLFPSQTETFGNVLLEGMASGLVTVAFDYAAAADHVVDGQNGYKAEFGSEGGFIEAALRAVQGNAESVRHGARQTAMVLSWKSIFSRLEGYYATVVQAGVEEDPEEDAEPAVEANVAVVNPEIEAR